VWDDFATTRRRSRAASRPSARPRDSAYGRCSSRVRVDAAQHPPGSSRPGASRRRPGDHGAGLRAGKIAPDKRLDADKLVAAIRERGREAWIIDGAEVIALFLAERAIPGDQVLIMSNGGFGGLHGLLLDKLRAGT